MLSALERPHFFLSPACSLLLTFFCFLRVAFCCYTQMKIV